MARPRKEGLDYFPCDVHFDEKIKAIELLHKNEGLIWILKFWQVAYSTNSGEVNLNGVFGVIHAENCRITTVKQEEIIGNCLEIGLIIQLKDGIYTSNGIQKRLNEIVKDRENERKRKLVGNFPLENKPLMGESKVKESKVKESKVNNIKGFIPPTLEEIITYCKERNNKIDPEVFFHTYKSQGWIKTNGQPILNWKSTIITWEKKNNNYKDNGEERWNKL